MNSYCRKTARFISVIAVQLFLLTFAAGAQTWFTNSPLQTARWNHTTTALNDGTVLISGGIVYNVAGDFRNTNAAEIYDPVANTTTTIDPLLVTRNQHTATLLNDGTVLVAGGSGDATSEIYDTNAQTWVGLVSMQEPRLGHTATLLADGTVLAAGGGYDFDFNNAEFYDPNTQTWTLTGDMPYAMDSAAAVLLPNGKVLVCGGSTPDVNTATNAILYDPNTHSWTNTGPMLKGRSGHTATLMLNGKVLVVGGNGDNTAEVYDPGAGKWSFVSPANDGRQFASSLLLPSGKVMVFGDGNTDVELYDSTNDVWSFAPSMPVAGTFQGFTLAPNGNVVVTGGSESTFNGPPLNVVETFGIPMAGSITVTVTPTSGLVPLTVQFTSPAIDSTGHTVNSYLWDFGDGSTSTNQSPSHTYNSTGFFNPTLDAETTNGADTVFGLSSIFVSTPTLTVTASPQSGQEPLTVQFTSPAVDSSGHTVTNWNWDFYDGTSSTNRSPVHTYTHGGFYYPSLTAKSTFGPQLLEVVGPGTINVTFPPLPPSFTTIYNFSPTSGNNATNDDGSSPNAGLLVMGDLLYGTAGRGGTAGHGTFFSVHTNGTGFTNMLNFDFPFGVDPNGGLVASGGTLFGTTVVGGSGGGGGTVFAVKTNGTGYTNLYNFAFSISNTGDEPIAGVLLANGFFYGMTEFGGASDAGALYGVATNGSNFIALHSFSHPFGNNFNGDGLFPQAKMIESGPTLYGTAENGGGSASGTIFSVNTNNPGTFQIIHTFTGGAADGSFPFCAPVLSGGLLYGTTYSGGTSNSGTVFAISTNGGGYTNIYSFTGGNDGLNPRSSLCLSGNKLYGSASGGGTYGLGTLFSLNTDGSGFTTLFTFTGGADGANPTGDLTLSGNTLYGASAGGSTGDGVIFSFALPTGGILLVNPTNLANGTFQFSFTNTAGAGSTVYGTTNLTKPFNAWSNLGSATEVTSGQFRFNDTHSTNFSTRFYRVSSP